MKVLTKQQKEMKIEKINSYFEKYPVLHFVENNNIPTRSIQSLRSMLKGDINANEDSNKIIGKIFFVRKSLLRKKFPSWNYPENFFLIFGNKDLKEIIEEFRYPAFAKPGDIASQTITIPAGIIKFKNIELKEARPQGSNLVLDSTYTVCNQGDILNEEQVSLLEAMGTKLGENRLRVIDIKRALE